MGGYFNIVAGLIMFVAGVSGRFTLIGTQNSGWLLAGIGALVMGIGIYRVKKYRNRNRN